MRISLVPALLLVLAAPAAAQGRDKDRIDCEAAEPNRALRGCTAILERGERETAANQAIAFNNRGYAYLQKGDHHLAINDFDAAIRLDPKYALAFNNRGIAYRLKGDHERAIREYDEAIRLDPKDARALRNRGYAYEQKGDPARALADHEAALNLDSSYAEAREGKQRALAALAAAKPVPAPSPGPQPTQAATNQAPLLPGRHLALVFGIDSYHHIPSLSAARNDARSVAEILKDLGFETLEAIDPDRRAMSRRIADLESQIQPGDSVFFFFAGHAIAHQGRNWLLPADMPEIAPSREGELEDEAFAADNLLDRFRRRGALMNVMVLDACRNNPFEREGATRSAFVGTRGLERMPPPEGVFIFYSAAEKERALDHLPGESHPNSVFTRILVEELKPGRRLVDIALATQRRVRDLAQKSGMIQRPAYYDNFAGEYALR